MIPTGTGKLGKMEGHFPVREKSGNFEKSGTWFPPGLEMREDLEKWEGIFQSGKSQGFCQDWKSILLKILEKSEKMILEN